MSAGSAKQKVLELIEKLPADATLEDAIERLVLLAKTERGLAELDAGQGVDHTEAKPSTSPVTRVLWAPQAIPTSRRYVPMSPVTLLTSMACTCCRGK
jgi:hypothetical protein